MLLVIASVVIFTGVIVALVFVLTLVSAKLSPGGTVVIDINDGEKTVETSPGSSLLATLAAEKIFAPSACGGGGTCGTCKCRVLEGGGDVLPTELGLVTKKERQDSVRLGCQVKVRQDMKIALPPAVLDVKKWECTVVSNRNVATFIKELVLDLPPGETLDFRAGGYIQIDVPPYQMDYAEIDVDERFRADWEKFGFFRLRAGTDEPVTRAYSMANHPAEGDRVMLNVRIATPPRGMDVPPGIVSSYIFGRKPGDKVTVELSPYDLTKGRIVFRAK